jgi:extracellular matrix protein 14
MRWSSAALLALPAAFLSCLPRLVTAIPSPATHFDQQLQEHQQPFLPPPQPKTRAPLWELSHRLIESVFGAPTDGKGRGIKKVDAGQRVPPHLTTRYGDQVVLRFNISTNEKAQSLADAADILMLDVWEFSHEWVDIRLSTDIIGPLLGLLPESLQQSHRPLMKSDDLTRAIHENYQSSQRSQSESDIFFSDYQPLGAIDAWMRLFASIFRTHVRTITIGTSYEGRKIPGLRVGVHPTNSEKPNPKRKTILVFGGLHAREWVSTSTVNYVAHSLITGYGKDQSITQLLEAFDFVFIPTLNPDGYVYTWETDRLWRKNRQPTPLRFCQGVDLDRSFSFHFDDSSTASSNPCSESYPGSAAFSAAETKALADWALNETLHHNVDFVGLLDLHSYSQEILYPYAYSCDESPPGLENLEELAFGLEKAIRLSRGSGYEVLPACEGNVAARSKSKGAKQQRLWPRMEASGGSALDWFYHEMRVRFAYQIKLRDRGTYGFLLPKEQIVPTGKEMLDALLYFGGFLGEAYNGDSLKLVSECHYDRHTS